jgi:glycosyltransferase involved in cell wall biosynthesis
MSVSSNALVSVGVLSYQRPEGLTKVLNGVLDQTYKNLEIIVSDNCSAMSEIDDVLNHFTSLDKRVTAYRQKVNIGMQPNHTFVVRKSTGEYFFWLHDDDYISHDYIEKCVARFSDSPNIELVGPKADAYLEGDYWFSYMNYSNVGESVYTRLAKLVSIGYCEPSVFQQYIFGMFRREALVECMWADGEYYYRETFSLFFRISERGFIHCADDVTLEKFNFNEDFKKWRDSNYVDKPKRYKLAGARVERFLPRTLCIISTVYRSQNLALTEKIRLIVFCLVHFLAALVASPIPLWKRIVTVPYRLARKAKHLLRHFYYILR